MAERINITVPNDLHERLQAVRDDINISRICQEAIEQAVILKEIKMKTLSSKEKVIERLRLERQKNEQEWFNYGKTDGLSDAEDLSYEDFEHLEKLYKERDEVMLNQLDDDLREWLEEKMSNFDQRPNKKVYLNGWIEGVVEFWDEIKDEI